MNKKSILITGGMGFIGANLVKRLMDSPFVGRLGVVDIEDCSPLRVPIHYDKHRVDIFKANIIDEKRMAELAKGFDIIFHLAAESHVQNSIINPKSAIHTNVLGTFSVLEAARQSGSRIIYASTSEVYGTAQYNPIDESHPLEPQSPYAATKLAAERLVAAYVHTYGINATIVRMFNAYGPGQHYEKAIPMFVCSALCGLALPMQGDGAGRRDWTFIDDVCDRLISLIKINSPSLINLGSGTSKSILEIANKIASLSKLKLPRFEHLLERQGHVANQSADGNAIATRVGKIRIPFTEGLTTTINWYQEHMNSWRDDFLRDRQEIILRMKNHEIALHK